MDKIVLKAKTRDVLGQKTRKKKYRELIPAVVYGRAIKSQNLWIKSIDFLKLLKTVGESTIIELDIDGEKGRNVIIYEVQKNPVKDNIIHVDFFQVRMDEEIETEVELVYTGIAPAVKELGGVLVKNVDEVQVKCLPADLPSEIEVNIASLKTFEDRICVKDLVTSNKVKINLEAETVIALVSAPRTEEELDSLEEKVEADVSKVEGIEKENDAEEEEKKEETKREKGEKMEEKK